MNDKLKELAVKVVGFFRGKGGNVAFAVIAVAAAMVVGCCGYQYRMFQTTKFHDVTIELGDPMPAIEAFLTDDGNPEMARLVTEVDLNTVGVQELTFTQGWKRETIQLTIQDTTAPKVKFQDLTMSSREELSAEDFVVSVEELSAYTVAFSEEVGMPKTYEDITVQVVVTDAYGNAVTGECHVSFRWMKEAYTLELGDMLMKWHLLYHFGSDRDLLDQTQLDQIAASPVGTYTVTSLMGDAENTCIVTVQDTVAPELKLQDVAIFLGENAQLEDFLVSAADLSGDVAVRLTEPLPLNEAGTYTVMVEAEDINGNVATAQAQLQVKVDTRPPEFSGVGTLYVEKHSSPDYLSGVSAFDSRDGSMDFTVDTSRVDTGRAGTYYAVYTSVDKEGNVATYRRQVVVNHDAEDTAALVASIAAELDNDPESIRNYVRDYIWYSYEWGGEDPVWYGFKTQGGNCYVHALCFEALLREKGYETQLIWVTDKTHYWNMVKIDGKWVHMDSTPGRLHEMYSVMNDETRYQTLSGRDWDRTAWPKVE